MKFDIKDNRKDEPVKLEKLHLFEEMNPYLENSRKAELSRPKSEMDSFLRNISRGK